MKVLLDLDIIIYKENMEVSNYSIVHLFYWLDKLKCSKYIHPYSLSEVIEKIDIKKKEKFNQKLEYNIIEKVIKPSEEFLNLFKIKSTLRRDKINKFLLYEVYSGRVDILITENRSLIEEASNIGLKNKVYSINSFISECTSKHPGFIQYNTLEVKNTHFDKVDVNDPFFDSFRESYVGFNEWFSKKRNEEVYICNSDEGKILGFLYLKLEGYDENYDDISPKFEPKNRLKVGTFKVESTGFRLGERFIKIIFDNALERNVDEIYVTLYTDREELEALGALLERWGFTQWGVKNSQGNEKECVLIKRLKYFDSNLSVRENFPNIKYHQRNKYILPIYGKYHTALLPDAKLKNEKEIIFTNKNPKDKAHRYALQKIYISWAYCANQAKPGDLLLFYRPGEEKNKKYTSVITSIGMVHEIINIISLDQLLNMCKNRSVFSIKELEQFWYNKRENLTIIKFIFVKSLSKKIILKYLYEKGIVLEGKGPRPFTSLTDAQYNEIIEESQTKIIYS